MNMEQIESLLSALNCKNTVQNGNWVRCSCPLAPFLHTSGGDSKPSFGVESVIGGARFHCFTCLSGSIEQLVQTFEMYVQQNPDLAKTYDLEAARLILENKELNVHTLPDFEQTDSQKQFQEWPAWFLDYFPPALHQMRSAAYLKSPKPFGRGMTDDEIRRWDFRYDNVRDMVVIPFYDAYGRFAGMRGRSVEGKGFHDYKWNKVNNTSLCWANEQCFQHYETIVVVEGQFDMNKVARVYPHVIANLTAKITTGKLDKLKGCASIIFMLDNDETGVGATSKAIEYLQKSGVQVGLATYTAHDPDLATEQEIYNALASMIPIDKLIKP